MTNELSVPAILTKFVKDRNFGTILIINDLLSLAIAEKMNIQGIRKRYLNSYVDIVAKILEMHEDVLVILPIYERSISEIIFVLKEINRILSGNEDLGKVLIVAIADSRLAYERFLEFSFDQLDVNLPLNLPSLYTLLDFAVVSEKKLQIFLLPSLWINIEMMGVDIEGIKGFSEEGGCVRLGKGDILLLTWGYYYDIALNALTRANLLKEVSLIGILRADKYVFWEKLDGILLNYKIIVVLASDTLLKIVESKILKLIENEDVNWIPTVIFWGERNSNKVITSSGVLDLIKDLLGIEKLNEDHLKESEIIDKFVFTLDNDLLESVKEFRDNLSFEDIFLIRPLGALDTSIIISESLVSNLARNRSIIIAHLSSIVKNLGEFKIFLDSQISAVIVIILDYTPKSLANQGVSAIKDILRNKGLLLRTNRDSLDELAKKVKKMSKAIIILE